MIVVADAERFENTSTALNPHKRGSYDQWQVTLFRTGLEITSIEAIFEWSTVN